MRRIKCLSFIFLIFCSASFGQTGEFTYQGRLVDGSLAAQGTYEMRFRLFDDDTDGTQQPQGAPITLDFTVANGNAVVVSNGIFTVKLDFTAAAFPGAARFLEISVRRTASDPFTLLNPRQPITSAPHNIRSLSSGLSDGLSVACVLCVTDAQILSLDGGKVTGTVANATTAVNVSGIVPIANGGTGSSTQNFVDLSTNQSILGNKNFLQTATFSSASIGSLTGGSAIFNSVAINNANPVTISGVLDVSGAVTAEQFGGSGEGLTNVPGTFNWQSVSGLVQQSERNTGYVATHDTQQVTITLPASLLIGDTVRVSGAGSGGWKIAQNTGQSIIGVNIGLTGLTWTPRDSNRSWQSVASSADGTKLVVVVGLGQLYTSTDSGVTWTPRDSNRNWISAASSADGTKLVAVVSGGQIYTSIDSGATWTPQDSNRVWISIASSADGTKLVAVVQGGQIYTSTDSGVTWAPRDSNRNWQSVASSADGTKLVAVVQNGRIYTSANSGVSWVPHEANRLWWSVASSADGTKLVAVVNGGQIYTSVDSGGNWAPREMDRIWQSVASSTDGTKLVAATDSEQIYLSNDSGVSWTPRGPIRNWYSIASSADGTKLVAVVVGGQIYTSTSVTTIGTAGYVTGGQHSAIELQYIGNGKFLPLSYSGEISGF